ncbi:MAG TPA: FliH/SctL family protein [Pseudothermotoga sp.]|nr:FliH/SctL family protein [Pseudothermotoga sp.]HOK83447.1 FliH/SctL family protein [Pseudothermotoga sp.]HPP69520.1 FliH/SctL family protein [Pseudothermotoga sp.]
MIIKKRQLFIDSPYVFSQTKATEDPTELFKKAEQELRDAHEQANQIINEAQLKAKQIIENAKKDSQSILEKSKKEAELAQSQMKATVQTLNKIVEEFRKQLNSKIADISNELTEILHILTKKMAYREINKVDYQKKIENILSKIIGMSNIKVTMNTEDFESFPQIVEQFKSLGMELVKSAALKRGEIIVDTEIGVIDGTNQYLTQIIDQLLEEAFGSEPTS